MLLVVISMSVIRCFLIMTIPLHNDSYFAEIIKKNYQLEKLRIYSFLFSINRQYLMIFRLEIYSVTNLSATVQYKRSLLPFICVFQAPEKIVYFYKDFWKVK